MAVAIDTLAYARRLREAGFSEQQAEGSAQALAGAMTDTLATKIDLQQLATKDDLRQMELVVKDDLRQMDISVKDDLRQMELAVKDDLRQTESRLEARMDAKLLESERRMDLRMDARLADLERRMTMRLGGIMVAGIGFLSALVKLS